MKRFPRILGRWMTLAALVAMTGTSRAQTQVTLGANANLDGGAALGSLANSGGDGTWANPWLYEFTTGDLDCGIYKVYTTVDLVNEYGTAFKIDMGGYSVTGVSGSVSLSTAKTGSGSWDGCGSITVLNVDKVNVGGIDTSSTWSRSQTGPVRIGTYAVPASQIRADYIHVQSPSSVDGTPGVYLYCSGDVLIETTAGTAGNIDTHGRQAKAVWDTVIVSNNGAFLAKDIDFRITTEQWDNPSAWGGNVTLDGITKAGAAAIRNVDGRFDSTLSGNGNGLNGCGNVIIRNYSSVTVSNLWMSYAGRGNVGAGAGGGDVTITNITGNITVNGSIDLSATHVTSDPDAVPGKLTLGAGGTITVNSLNLSNMLYAAFDGNGSSYIVGLLSGTNGLPATGLADIGTRLRTPAGEKIFYYPGQNPGLALQTLTLANLAGTAGSGGQLAPVFFGGTVFRFK